MSKPTEQFKPQEDNGYMCPNCVTPWKCNGPHIPEKLTEPSEGLKYDSEKPRVDLLDPEWLIGVSNVLTFGANKYAAHNWRGGISYSRLIAASLRHLLAIMRGEDIDPESGLGHVYHMSCCLMFLSWMLTHRSDLDDRWKQ